MAVVKEERVEEVFNTQTTSWKRTRFETDHITNDDEGKSSAMERAEKFQRNLPSEIPSFIKFMLPSHITGGFWLGLPKKFCNEHMPKTDSAIVLVDKSRKEYMTKYLERKTGLSAGWRGFSIAHNLLEGDVLVFRLVQPTKFMVHIARKNGFDEVGEASLVFRKLETCAKQEDFASNEDLAGKDNKRWKKEKGKCLKHYFPNSPPENTKESLPESTTELGSDGHGPEVLERIRLSESALDFKDVKCIKDFSIHVNGLAINSEFSKHIQTKYYELCCSQKTYLHDHLPHGLNQKLAAGIISQTVNIAYTIRASNLTTLRNNFSTLSKTLKSFQELGMNVGFLRARLDQLMSYGFVEKRKTEARLERQSAEEKIRELEGSLLHAREVKKRLDAEIEALNSPVENHEVMFQKLAQAPWSCMLYPISEVMDEIKQRTSEWQMKKKPSATRTFLPKTRKRHLNFTHKTKKVKEVFNTQQKATSCKRTRVETDHLTNGDEAKSSAMERALKVHIFRTNGFDENFEHQKKTNQRRMYLKNCLPNSPQENTNESLTVATTELGHEAYQSEKDSTYSRSLGEE